MASGFRERRRTAPAADRRREIVETAARLMCAKGYEGTSIHDVAAACGLTKAGLYHHIESKEQLLQEVMSHGLDVLEAEVLYPSLHLTDPVARLSRFTERLVRLLVVSLRLPRAAAALRLRRAADAWRHAVIVLFQEEPPGASEAREPIERRRNRLVRFLEDSFAEAVREGRLPAVSPRVAAHALLGTALWLRKWYRPEGPLPEEDLVSETQDLFFGRFHSRAPKERETRKRGGRPRRRQRP